MQRRGSCCWGCSGRAAGPCGSCSGCSSGCRACGTWTPTRSRPGRCPLGWRLHGWGCSAWPLAQKYDPQHERELRVWIEGTTGRRIGDNFMDGLKDGVILCELINKLQPGSVPKVNEPVQNWHKQLENIGNFLRAITRYGVKPHDIFEANDLFENTNHTQVQSTLIALARPARSRPPARRPPGPWPPPWPPGGG
uniref:Calponin 1 n=1 Tax=Junco hyemalis TaxID=40217 RepID=A0A8C5JSK3_JUNHY